MTLDLIREMGATIAREYKEGRTIEQLADDYDMCTNQVRKWCKRHGVVFTGKHRKCRAWPVQEWKRLYAEGEPCKAISELHNCSQSTVWKILKREGVNLNGRGCPLGTVHDGEKTTVEQRERMRDRIAECRGTQIAIAKEFGVSREYVRQQAEIIGVTWYTLEAKAQRKLSR